MTACIDLNAAYGAQYRVVYEESYQGGQAGGRRVHDQWLLTIPCQFGHIYPHGADHLGASTSFRGPVAKRLAALPCVRVVQDGDDGINVVFHIDDFEAVAEVMKPRRRRRLTPDQRAERVERLRKYQFGPASQSGGGDRRRDPSPSGDKPVRQRSAGRSRPAPGV